MLQRESRMVVADNTGAKEVLIMHIPGNSHIKKVSLGAIVTVVVKKSIPHGSIKKSEVVKAIIVRVKKEVRRKDGSYVRFDDNACVIIDPKSGLPRGTRVFGPIAREIREKNAKLASLAIELV